MSNKPDDLKDMFNAVAVPPELDLTIEKAIQHGRRHKMRTRIFTRTAAAASLALIVGAAAIGTKNMGYLSGKSGKVTQNSSEAAVQNEEKLPVVASLQNLTDLIDSINPKRAMYGSEMLEDVKSNSMAAPNTDSAQVQTSTRAVKSPGGEAAVGGTGSDYSKTNVQVEGVDEGDIVKTDGQYIYRIKGYGGKEGRTIQIIKVNDGKDMKVASKIQDTGIYFTQIYITDKYLAVIGNKPREPYKGVPDVKAKGNTDSIRPYMYYPPSSVLAIYDITDKTNVKKLREVETDGYFSDSRMIGSNIYMISNKGIPYDILKGGNDNDVLKPSYKDSAAGKDYTYIDYKDIKYCPEAVDSNYIMVTSVNLSKPMEKVKVTSTLGSASNIYCSADNLYVAGYNYGGILEEGYKTAVYKFSLKDGNIIYKASGKVPGNILNQFSMDESNGYFRIATTVQNYNQGKDKQNNNLYVLDGNMKLTGSLENLAKGEQIYSVRFMGDRAYIVTFRTTDPLFAIDLKNPAAPKVLGELKIPGYSNYLQPYDENHIIGFGKDAEVVDSGKSTERAYYQGMKLAIFDVTDVNNPKVMFKTGIGDRGTNSDILYDHKALLFSKEKGLLAFPVEVSEIKDKDSKNAAQYGTPTFMGAYVYHIDLDSGFTLKGKIDHGKVKTNSNGYMSDSYYKLRINRILYIDENLYTLSEDAIKANRLTDLSQVGSLKTP